MVRDVIFSIAVAALFADEPDLSTGQTYFLWDLVSVGYADSAHREARGQRPLRTGSPRNRVKCLWTELVDCLGDAPRRMTRDAVPAVATAARARPRHARRNVCGIHAIVRQNSDCP